MKGILDLLSQCQGRTYERTLAQKELPALRVRLVRGRLCCLLFSLWEALQVRFFVEGKPITQGSMNSYNGRSFHTNDKELRVWREKIAEYADHFFAEPLQGSVYLLLTFYLEKPKSAKRDEPFVKPDLDKLVRACGDALTGVAFSDDSQVTTIVASKVYAEVGQRIGVLIGVFTKTNIENSFDVGMFCYRNAGELTVKTGDNS